MVKKKKRPGNTNTKKNLTKPHWSQDVTAALNKFQSEGEDPMMDSDLVFGQFVGLQLKGMTLEAKNKCLVRIMSILTGDCNCEHSNKTNLTEQCESLSGQSIAQQIQGVSSPSMTKAKVVKRISTNSQAVLPENTKRAKSSQVCPSTIT